MSCLLIAATAKEIGPFLDHHRSIGSNYDIDILIAGIGMTATTWSLAKQLSLRRPEFIIQAGIAGSFDKNISLASVVVVSQDTIADLGVIEMNELKTIFDLNLVSRDQFPFKKGWLVNSSKDLIRKTRLKAVSAISINQITTSKQMINFYRQKFDPVIESMEGAALHYVCLSEKIPFLQIRSISNYIGERDKKKWKIKDAIVNLNRELTSIFDSLQP